MYLLCAYRKLVDAFARRYRPELHYMRGPGPKWRERHRSDSAADGEAKAQPAVSRPARARRRFLR